MNFFDLLWFLKMQIDCLGKFLRGIGDPTVAIFVDTPVNPIGYMTCRAGSGYLAAGCNRGVAAYIVWIVVACSNDIGIIFQ